MPTSWSALDVFNLSISLLTLIYVFVCFFMIAKKTGFEPIAWWAFVPILNLVLALKIAGRPMWWLALLVVCAIIPYLGWLGMVVLLAVIQMDIAKKRGKAAWIGVLCVIPIVNYAALGYLAFAD